MDTNPTPIRRRTRLAAALVGLTALAVGVTRLAPAQTPAPPRGPAARLKLPQPIGPTDGPVVSRGSAPDYTSLDPTRQPPASAQLKAKPTGWFAGPQDAPPPPIGSQPVSRPVPQNRSGFGDALSGVREFVAGKPAQTQPPMPQPVARQNPFPPQGPGATGVYAGPPAYRWYGWGTTTPGSNPYAPTGNYPRGSANWYAQTGATPGAFPVPVDAGRGPVGPEPPAYAGSYEPPPAAHVPAPAWPLARAEKAPPPTPVPAPAPAPPPAVPTIPTPVTPVPTLPVGQPIAQTGPTFPATPSITFPATPVATTPAVPIVQSAPVSVIPPPMMEAPSTGGLVWQPASGPAQPFAPPATPAPLPPPSSSEWGPPKASAEPGPNPVFRSQQPGPPPAELAQAVRNACYGWATLHEVKHTAPGTLVIRLIAATEADAQAAVQAVAKIPQIQPYEVKFEAKLGK